MTSAVRCRPAEASDAETLAALIRRLAAHHGDHATVTADGLREDGFGPTPRFAALIAEDVDGPVGYALWTLTYNAVFGRIVLELQHLFVADRRRRSGIGRTLVREVVRQAEAEGCHRVRLGVRPQNTQALAFYRGLGFAESPQGFFVDRDRFRLLTEGSAEPG